MVWRFAVERENLWIRVIDGKYGHKWGNWEAVTARDRHGMGIWKAEMKIREDFFANVAYKIGNGRRVRFWKDRWTGGTPLSEAFPALFDTAMRKDAAVEDLWDISEGTGSWHLDFRRNFNDWEVQLVADLMQIIQEALVAGRGRCGRRETVASFKEQEIFYSFILQSPGWRTNTLLLIERDLVY